jgi:hypothetical protein
MSSILAAKAEWEEITIPYPMSNLQSYGEIPEEPFRRYGDAIACLDWDDRCTLGKIETLNPRNGGATSLLLFLKSLALKHDFLIYGVPVIYQPSKTLPPGLLLSQEELETWFEQLGFIVGKSSKGVPFIWYPRQGD